MVTLVGLHDEDVNVLCEFWIVAEVDVLNLLAFDLVRIKAVVSDYLLAVVREDRPGWREIVFAVSFVYRWSQPGAGHKVESAGTVLVAHLALKQEFQHTFDIGFGFSSSSFYVY